MSPFHRSRDKDGPQAVPKHHSRLSKFFKMVTGAKSTLLTPGPIAASVLRQSNASERSPCNSITPNSPSASLEGSTAASGSITTTTPYCQVRVADGESFPSGPNARSSGSAEPVVPTEDLSNLHLGGTNASSLKQDTGERLIETAQPNDTELCAPPFESAAAAAKAARPGPDARVPDDHQPPAALQALPPDLPAESAPKPSLTESTEQPTPLLSVSERLWNAAYDSLETVDAELVVSYVKTLETVLGDKTREPSAADLSAKLKDPSKRQTYMRDLLEKGQQKISGASRITTGVGKVADFILSAKEMVDLVLRSVPQAAPAALPWAGLCLGLQVSNRPLRSFPCHC